MWIAYLLQCSSHEGISEPQFFAHMTRKYLLGDIGRHDVRIAHEGAVSFYHQFLIDHEWRKHAHVLRFDASVFELSQFP